MVSTQRLILIYGAIVLAPLALSAAQIRAPRSFWDEIASGAGMLAFAIILVEFTLSGRFRSISRRVGMDVTMRAHQLIARTALAAALVHPFLYRAERDAAILKPPMSFQNRTSLKITAPVQAAATVVRRCQTDFTTSGTTTSGRAKRSIAIHSSKPIGTVLSRACSGAQ